ADDLTNVRTSFRVFATCGLAFACLPTAKPQAARANRERRHPMRASEVMTQKPECIRPDASLQEAAKRMKALNVGALPVCDNDRLVGMITDRDMTVRGTAEAGNARMGTVRDVMTPGVIYCFEDDLVSEVARLMEEKQVRRLPVLNRSKWLVGIISLG